MTQRRIVLVDDDSDIRVFVKAILKARGFEVHDAGDGQEALEVLKGLGVAVDLLITDIKMPRMDGTTLARALAQISPTIPVLFISGWTFDLLEDVDWRKPQYAFLGKPFLPASLMHSVDELLARSKAAGAE